MQSTKQNEGSVNCVPNHLNVSGEQVYVIKMNSFSNERNAEESLHIIDFGPFMLTTAKI